MKKTVIVANWKMNIAAQNSDKMLEYMRIITEKVPRNTYVIVLPPATHIAALGRLCQGNIFCGSQDISPFSRGAYTGDISANCVRDVGAKYVLLGHSERRLYHGETADLVRAKIAAAMDVGLKVILCLGETAQDYALGKTREVLTRQLEFFALQQYPSDRLLLAYEPIWAIGNGQALKGKRISFLHAHVRSYLGELAIPILYGGSVTRDNVREILTAEHVDGVLVGSASLTVESFSGILASC